MVDYSGTGGYTAFYSENWYLYEDHPAPYNFPRRPYRFYNNAYNGGAWIDDTATHSIPLLFPIIEPPCVGVTEVAVTTDSVGCVVASWDSLRWQEQWAVALVTDDGSFMILDTVSSCSWRYCGLPPNIPYVVSVRSRCTNLNSFSWSEWSTPVNIGIKQVPEGPSFSLAPNPTHGRVAVRMDGPVDGAHWELTDRFGRQLASYAVTSTSMELDVSGYPSGVYLLRLVSPLGVMTRSLILTH